jgi:hypothetical protein
VICCLIFLFSKRPSILHLWVNFTLPSCKTTFESLAHVLNVTMHAEWKCSHMSSDWKYCWTSMLVILRKYGFKSHFIFYQHECIREPRNCHYNPHLSHRYESREWHPLFSVKIFSFHCRDHLMIHCTTVKHDLSFSYTNTCTIYIDIRTCDTEIQSIVNWCGAYIIFWRYHDDNELVNIWSVLKGAD